MGWRRLVGEGAQTQGGMIWNSHIQDYGGRGVGGGGGGDCEVSLISEYIYINCSQNVTLEKRLSGLRSFFKIQKMWHARKLFFN